MTLTVCLSSLSSLVLLLWPSHSWLNLSLLLHFTLKLTFLLEVIQLSISFTPYCLPQRLCLDLETQVNWDWFILVWTSCTALNLKFDLFLSILSLSHYNLPSVIKIPMFQFWITGIQNLPHLFWCLIKLVFHQPSGKDLSPKTFSFLLISLIFFTRRDNSSSVILSPW